MTRYILLFACSLLLWTACSEDDGPLNPPDFIENDEYAVWSATLDSMVVYEKDDFVVLQNDIDDYALSDSAMASYLRGQLKVTDEVLESYKERNATGTTIVRKLNIEVDYVLLPRQHILDILNMGGYEEIYRRYPNSNGVTTLSRVGFNAARTTALVYFSMTPQYLAGSGWAVLLRKISGTWVVQASTIVWVS